MRINFHCLAERVMLLRKHNWQTSQPNSTGYMNANWPVWNWKTTKNSCILPLIVCHVNGHSTRGKLVAMYAWPRVRLVLDLNVTNWTSCHVYHDNTRGRLDTCIILHVSDYQPCVLNTRVWQSDTCIPILVAIWPLVLLYTCLTVRHVYEDTCGNFCFL
jgi:hypothetical protein